MIRAIEYKEGHLDLINIKDEFVASNDEFLNTHLSASSPFGLAFTLVYGSQVLGVIGYTEKFPGVIEIYSMLSKDVRDHPIGFHRKILQLMDVIIKKVAPKRMQCFVRADFKESLRWVEALGFNKEAELRNFGYDLNTYELWARLL